jgi:hypothetical protein
MSRSGRTVIVVHGHRRGNGRGRRRLISAECVARLSVAERAALDHRVEDVLLSGGGRAGFPSEAQQMAELWSGPVVRLWLDENSSDSAQNAEAGIRWAAELGAGEVIVVSSWWHLRLRLYYRGARRLGIKLRYRSAKRMNRIAEHVRHELRYLPRALRHFALRPSTPQHPSQRLADERIRSRLAELQLIAERQVLDG